MARSARTPAFTWTVIEDIKQSDVPTNEQFHQIGIAQFDFTKMSKSHGARRQYKRIDFLDLLMHLWPGDWRAQLTYMNSRIRASNNEKKNATRRASSARVRVVKEVSEQEFWIFWGLIIVGRIMGRKGDLWDKIEPEGEEPRIDYSKHMTAMYHRDIRSFVPYLFADPTKKRTDPWWQISKLIDGYNANRRETVCSSNLHVLDESMSAFRPQTRATGNLPHISHILRKPEPLDNEFKVLTDAGTNILLHLEIQKGKV